MCIARLKVPATARVGQPPTPPAVHPVRLRLGRNSPAGTSGLGAGTTAGGLRSNLDALRRLTIAARPLAPPRLAHWPTIVIIGTAGSPASHRRTAAWWG